MLQIVTGSSYLGGFVGSKEAHDPWLGVKMEGWQDSVATLDKLSRRHPQTAYTGLHNSVHQEWAFAQCVTVVIGMAFQAVEDELRDTFLPALFQGATSQILRRAITGLPIKQAGIALHDPTRTAAGKCTAF